MGKNSRGRGNSSAPRGRGQNNSLSRIRKSASPDTRVPVVLLTALDKNKLHPDYVAPVGPIATRMAANTGKQLQQQQSGAGSSSSTPGSKPAIPTSNQYEMLSDNGDGGNDEDDDEAGHQSSINTPTQGNQPKRNPPISVVDTPAAYVEKALLDGKCEFVMRILKTSVKIFTFGRPMFEKALELLRNSKIPYYTHETPEQAAVKIVLTGYNLPCTKEELFETIAEYGITRPRDARVLSKTESVTGCHYLWLLYFDRGSVKIQDLRKVKALDGLLVGWRYFVKRSSDAAQCHRCQRFGHGSRNCTLSPKCVKCGAAHLTGECTLPRKANLGEEKNAEQHKEKVKCANCQGNHTANFRGCSARKSYLEGLEKQRNKPAARQPPMTSTGKSSVGQSPTNPPGFGRTYANVVAGGTGPTPDGNGGGDLFTLTEFLSLARDMFTRLSTCRNKLEQFFGLQELMGKYLYGA